MGPKSEKRGRQGESKKNSARLPSQAHLLDQQLARILVSIAHLLIRDGYGFARMNRLAKIAFVKAAKEIDVGTPTRISNARIAAVTGLTRTEVSQLLRSGDCTELALHEPLNRAARVASGWLADSEFCDIQGNPRVLPFTSRRGSFTVLVKRYSGDIPARAMLSEMKRLRMVRHHADDTVRLDREPRAGSRQTLTAMRAISPWVHFFAALDSVGSLDNVESSARHLKLHFDSVPQILAASREIENRRTVFVEGLKQLSRRSKNRQTQQLQVSVAVAVAAPNRNSRRHRN